MTPERWQQIKAVLDRALELAPGERSAFLDRACAADQSLRNEVEELLAGGDEMGSSFMSTSPLAHQPLTEGTRLGDYEVQTLLGAGGMGEVYRARDVRLRRDVAIKVLPAIVCSDPDRLRRFEQEAQAAAALNHPNILAVYQLGEYQGNLYLVSELLEGETLRQQCERGPIPVRKAIDFAVQIARGLVPAHEKGIVHRDLKPENLFLTKQGRVKILDFGLAKLTQPLQGEGGNASTLDARTEAGIVMGTVGYMAPEQVRGRPADSRADIFAFGAILYEMVAGRGAFRKETSAETMVAILKEDPPSLSQIVPNMPLALQRIVVRCLEKNPEQRFQSASDLAFALEAISDSGSLGAEVSSPRSISTWRWILVLTIALAVIASLAVVLAMSTGKVDNWSFWRRSSGTGSPQIHSLAVLPLQNLSDSPAQEYFADGMTEELTTDLSKIGAVRVISRTSAMRYKGANKPLPEIARELNVDGVIEGSVERSGNRVRITAQLIHAPSDTHLWAESYERDLRDILSLQGEVARDIANKIKIRLTPTEQARLSSSGPVDPEAYQSYLEGRYYWNMRTEEGLDKGIEYFRKAIQKDPHYGMAYAGLADSYIVLAGYRIVPGKEAFPLAKEAALKALETDEGLGEAHASLAAVRAEYDLDLMAAEKEYRRAIELNPNSASAHQWYAEDVLAPLGRRDEAISEEKRAQQLDPLSLAVNFSFGYILYLARENDQAIAQLQKTLDMYRNRPVAHSYLGRVYVQKKMFAEAIEEFQSADTLSEGHPFYRAWLGYGYAVSGRRRDALGILNQLTQPSNGKYVSPYDVAAIWAGLGRTDEAVKWLQKAYEERASYFHDINVEPVFDPLRSDLRFQALVRLIGLPQ